MWRILFVAAGPSGASHPAANPPTAFTQAADASLPPVFSSAGRLTGGVCRASGEHTNGNPTQITQRLFDGSLASKWLDFAGGGAQGSAWVEYRLLPSQDPAMISHYDVISGEDCPERDPADWVLEVASSTAGSSGTGSSGRSDGDWVMLHACKGHRFSRRHQLCSFVVPEAARVASRAWRLRITRTADSSAATCVQLACWNLYCTQQQCPKQQLMYLDSTACGQLQALAAAAAAAATGGAAADSAAADSSGNGAAGAVSATQREGISTLKRILGNVQQQPADAKYFKLSAKASKLQQLLSEPLLQAAVFAVGFRPVLLEPTATDGQEQLALVADDSSSSTVRAAAGVLLALLEGDTAAEAGSGVATV